MSYTNAIQKMIDEGNDILQVAKLFGGIDKLMEISKSSPYLKAYIEASLGGYLHCSAEGEDEVMVPFSLGFIINELDRDQDDDSYHYGAYVDVIIPELTKNREMEMLYIWLDDYLSDMGAEIGQFNDGKLNKKMIWISIIGINGKKFEVTFDVSDKEVLEIIPNEYKEP